MNNDEIDFELLNKLPGLLKSKEPIYIDIIPAQVQEDLLTFLKWRTIGSNDGRKFIYKADFNDWLNKVYNHGITTQHDHRGETANAQ